MTIDTYDPITMTDADLARERDDIIEARMDFDTFEDVDVAVRWHDAEGTLVGTVIRSVPREVEDFDLEELRAELVDAGPMPWLHDRGEGPG